MKQVILIFAFVFLTASLYTIQAQEEDWNSKTYELGSFKAIQLEGGYKVYLTQGNENSLTVKASDSDVFNHLKVNNDQESLKLKVDREHFNFDRISLYITFKELERMDIEGGVKLKSNGYLNLTDFVIHVEGGARVELNLRANNVEVAGEGGVLFELVGVAETLDVRVSGAGHVDADELKTRDVSFRVEGVGTGSVYATEKLDARIQGVGKIRYRGEPEVTKVIDGLGTVSND